MSFHLAIDGWRVLGLVIGALTWHIGRAVFDDWRRKHKRGT